MDIVKVLHEGGVGVLATDTVYGVVARLFSPKGVERIYQVKQRNPHKPVGTILVTSATQLEGVVDKKMLAKALPFWPGPTSAVLPVSDELLYAHKGVGSLAFRIPHDEKLIELLEQTGPLATSSANLEGRPVAVNIQEAKQYFGDSVDFYEDSGTISHRSPSRIIKISEDGVIEEIRA